MLPLSAPRIVLAVVVCVAALSCGEDKNMRTETIAEGRALAALDALAAHLPTLAPALAARVDGFVRAPNDESEDCSTRGRIVSEGWRAAKTKRWDGMGARLPNAASDAFDAGSARFDSLHVHGKLVGASAQSMARVREGRVVYANALASVDRVLVADATSLEELLVLHDASAPLAFSWRYELSSGLAAIREADGALRFEDAYGTPKLTMHSPQAWDATGAPISLHHAWNAAAQTYTVTLDVSRPLAYPVVVDPKYDLSVWVALASRNPGPASTYALTYDSKHGEVLLFGDVGFGDETWGWNGATGTWKRHFTATQPSSRDYAAMAFDARRGEVVLFGGYTYVDAIGELDDTWIWNGDNETWNRRTPATQPSVRSQHAMAFDATRNEVVLFGGNDGVRGLNDTWVWNGDSPSWTRRSPATSPAARADARVAFDAVRSETVLFGGVLNSGSYAGDTWTWNGTTWTQAVVATSPPGRGGHGMSVDNASNVIVFAGSTNGAQANNDTWVWNGGARTWTQRAPVGGSPGTRTDMSMAYDSARGEAIVVGGFKAIDSSSRYSDTWAWNGTLNTWTQRDPVAGPQARAGHALAYDSARKETLLFGGLGADTWTWDGLRWTLRSPPAAPTARQYHALAYDAVRGEVLFFGGAVNGGGVQNFRNDTWVWNGASGTWAQRTPAQSPSARAGHAMAFDAARGEVILFGGTPATTPSNAGAETWGWNGTTWAKRALATSPPSRSSHVMAFDSKRREVVLFGGSGALGFVNDTWTWDGSNWTQRSAPTSPSARQGASVAFDDVMGQALLFGGNDQGNVFLGDTWAWDGSLSTWTRRTAIVSPLSRQLSAATFDGARRQVVLFGGYGQSGTLADTWLHQTLGGTCSVNTDCIDGNFCVDGVCCNVSSCATCETCAGTGPGRCTPVLNTEDPDTCAARDHKSCSNVGECKAALGMAAPTASACASGSLVDGVCCATESCGPCQTCDIAAAESGITLGTCNFARAGTDPHDSCPNDGPLTCARDGMCDGRGACRNYKQGTACGSVTCIDNRATGRVCNGLGVCDDSARGSSCDAYACDMTLGCPSTCADNTQCAQLYKCEAGTCVAERGAACDGAHTVTAPNGSLKDCTPYRCEGATCRATCRSKNDCTDDADCTPGGECVTFTGLRSSDSGGCSVRGDAHGTGATFAAAAAVAALVTARRQKRTIAALRGWRHGPWPL